MLRLLTLLAALVLPIQAYAGDNILARLAEPRTHAVMRHAQAPGGGDPENFELGNCATQRNLNEDGRRQAGRAGDLIRAAGVRIDVVWSSQYCRCLETVRLMDVGPVTEKADLNSFSAAPYKGPGKTRRVREALAALPPDQTVLLVTHNVNAESLTGDRPVPGEIQVVHVSEAGEVTLLGAVRVPMF